MERKVSEGNGRKAEVKARETEWRKEEGERPIKEREEESGPP